MVSSRQSLIMVNDCPSKQPNISDLLNEDEQLFINLCYTPQGDLKLDLNEFQRGKLPEILRQVAYKQFLNAVTQFEQTDVEL